MTSLDRPHHFIGGAWVSPSAADLIAVENPATEEVIAHVPAGSAADVELHAVLACSPSMSRSRPSSKAPSSTAS